MKILLVDTETTGKLNRGQAIAHPSQPDLAQIAAKTISIENGTNAFSRGWNLVHNDSYESLIKPSSFTAPVMGRAQEWRMDPGAQEVHGLSHEKCEAEGVPLGDALRVLYALSRDADLIVAYNSDFDRNVLHRALLRLVGMSEESELPNKGCPYRSDLQWWDPMKPLTDIVRVAGPMRPDEKKDDGYAWVKVGRDWQRRPPWYQQPVKHLFGSESEKTKEIGPELASHEGEDGLETLHSGGIIHDHWNGSIDQIENPVWKWPDLNQAYRFCTGGQTFENAHDAMADVQALAVVVCWCFERGLMPGSKEG